MAERNELSSQVVVPGDGTASSFAGALHVLRRMGNTAGHTEQAELLRTLLSQVAYVWQSLPVSERELPGAAQGEGGSPIGPRGTGALSPTQSPSPADTVPADIAITYTADTEMDAPDLQDDEEQLAAMQAVLADAGDATDGDKIAGLRTAAAKLERKVSAAREGSVRNRTLKQKTSGQANKGAGCS